MGYLRLLACWILFFGAASLGSYLVYLYEQVWEREQEYLIKGVATSQAASIERRLARSLSSTYLLKHEVRYNEGRVEGFDQFAEQIIRSTGGISNLQLAPDGVIRYIYPLAGNEKAIGHDLLRDDKRRAEAMLAVDERQLTLAGPFELIQGGVAVIGRNPVFVNEGDQEVFWGFASALIYLETLLSFTDLDSLEARGYSYEISRMHPDTGKPETFHSSQKQLGPLTQSHDINVPNSVWTLTVSRPLPERPLELWEGVVMSTLVAALLAFLLAYILKEPQRLKLIVAEKTKQLNDLAFYDVLTGLVNRRLFLQQLEYEIKLLQRTGKKAALMYLDLDDFKKVNDTLGHNAGDQLLIEVANRIKATMRESDIVCRLGGDEYAILMMNVDRAKDCKAIAEKIIKNVRQEMVVENHTLNVSLSIGITLLPEDATNLRELLNNADMALYESKKLGKNQASFFNHSLQAQAVERLRIEQELKIAIENGDLELYYQPIIRLANRQVVMLEALIRWNHPERGLIPPDKFIPVAEQCGLILTIGDWVIEQACARIKRSLEISDPLVPIAINISAKQLANPNFAVDTKQIFNRYGIDPAMIEMEITETTIMENMEEALRQLRLLRNIGCRCSIDDFGTGYSSLAQLKQLPVDALKIDRSFVRDVEHDHHDRQIVEAIIAMAHRLGLSVIAEGVENQTQLDFIDSAGCDLVQGYLFSKPLPYSELEFHELIT